MPSSHVNDENTGDTVGDGHAEEQEEDDDVDEDDDDDK
jgi:hypothetical protein